MDIFRLLSRSTKQPSKTTKDGTVSTLPSAGSAANPQLYHSSKLGSRGKKRKRGAEQSQELVDDEINFFAPKTDTKTPKKPAVTGKTSGISRPSDNAPRASSKLLDEVEVRNIHRSHRLKVTLLASPVIRDKQKKSSKGAKASKKAQQPKEENKQLYPQPLESFSDLQTTYGIYGRMAENLLEQGYKIPTEVQMGSLPLLLQPALALGESATETGGEVDLLAVAPTGSGKTLAFLIPIINQVIQNRRTKEDKGEHDLQAIVIAPTKELASQIVNEAKKLIAGTGVKVVGMRKGMNVVQALGREHDEGSVEESESDEQDGIQSAKGVSQPSINADILITTPGLLFSAISSGDAFSPLPTVRTLVLDEADVLLDPLFREQTLRIWESCIDPELRVTLWSATMGSNIETLALSIISSRKARLGLGDGSRLVRLIVGLKDSAIPNITHRLTYAATEPGKLIALRQLFHPTAKSADANASLRPPFLVFTQTIPRAVALHSELLYDIPAEAGGSSRIAVLHSDLSDVVRDQVMTRFRNGEIWVLITTDILSRGVDFKGINGVVNYDVPNSGAAYIHRVGRTGRAGRDGGVAVTLYTKEDIPYVRNIANIIAASEKQAGKPPSEVSMKKWLLDALPKPSKEEKKNLKKRGVEARRAGVNLSKEPSETTGRKGRMQISTKSGYERKLQNNRKGAIQGSQRRMRDLQQTDAANEKQDGEGIEWSGFDD